MNYLNLYTIEKIPYEGDSIGDDFRIQISIGANNFDINTKLKHNQIKNINQVILSESTNDPHISVPIKIKITEQDLLFNDEGTIEQVIEIDNTNQKEDHYDFTVNINEYDKVILKKTAKIKINLTIRTTLLERHLLLQKYNDGLRKEDYNHLDNAIINAVDHWNLVFSLQTGKPPKLLDPNLVKAMAYVESQMGYALTNGTDVMQIKNPADRSLSTLRGELIEYELTNGKEKKLFYPQASADTHAESILWGTRWLYHKAQIITKKERSSRKWKTWRQAVFDYNGGGDPNYIKKVYGIYNNGYDELINKIKLFTLILFITTSIAYANDKIEAKETTEVGCRVQTKLSKKDIENCTYEIKRHDGYQWLITLKEGKYQYTENTDEYINYEASIDGPYQTTYTQHKSYDVNQDGKQDAIVVLKIDYGGTGSWYYIITMVREKNMLIQKASYQLNDREQLRDISVKNNKLLLKIITQSKAQCCPDTEVTRSYPLNISLEQKPKTPTQKEDLPYQSYLGPLINQVTSGKFAIKISKK